MYIAIDIGASKVRAGIFDENTPNALLSTKNISVSNDFDASMKDTIKLIHELASGKRITGIGSTLNGIVDVEAGLIKDCANLQGWINKPYADILRKEFNTKVRVDNDMVIAALGEFLYGAGVGQEKLLYIVWGSGFGAAFIEKIGDRVKVSQIEAGHQILKWQGRDCLCGQKGCAEAYIGGIAAEQLYGKPLSDITDESVWEEIAQNAGHALINTLNHYPTDYLVFGGGVVNKQPHLLGRIEKVISANMTLLETPKMNLSKLGDDTGLYGALGLFFVNKI